MTKSFPAGYRIDICWGALDEDRIAQIAAFLNAKALKDPQQALARARESAALAFDDEGNLVAVLSAAVHYSKQLLNKFWTFAVYVSDAHRRHGIPTHLNLQVRDYFEARFREGKDPHIIGTFLAMQSPLYRKTRTEAVTSNSGAIFVGRNSRGHDIRVYYFAGAHISPEDPAQPGAAAPAQQQPLPARVELCWERRDEAALQSEITAFLLRESAVESAEQAQKRAQCSAALAYDSQDALVAQVAVASRYVEQLQNMLWHVVIFVAPAYRSSTLAPQLTAAVRDLFEAHFGAGKYQEVIGLFAILPSQPSTSPNNLAVTPQQLAFVGRNRRGDNMRVYYFKGAHIDLSHQLSS